MDWDNIIDNTLRGVLRHRRGVLRHRRDRPQHPVRLRRPAQLRPGRVPGLRRLRPRACRRSTSASRCGGGSLFGLVFAVVLGLIMGVPTLRLRADYLAIVTISIAEVIRLFVRSQTFKDVFGGADGISDFSAAYRDLSPFDPSRGYGVGPFQNDGVMRWLLLRAVARPRRGRRAARDALALGDASVRGTSRVAACSALAAAVTFARDARASSTACATAGTRCGRCRRLGRSSPCSASSCGR